MSTTPSPIELVDVRTISPSRFAEVLDEDGLRDLERLAEHARTVMQGRTLWCVNSTAKGGGVAEMLESMLAYTAGAGVDSRWAVIGGEPDFFRITKRIHNRLHGAEGDGGGLGDGERPAYEAALEPSRAPLAELVGEGDVVIVHDPQPAGLIADLKERGAVVVWRVHVGADEVDDDVREAWDFLRPYIAPADALVFSSDAFVWEDLEAGRTATIAPSIDVFAPKNEDLDDDEVDAILVAAGLLDGEARDPEHAIEHRAELLEEQPLPAGRPFVLQVSRWDALKDHRGVLEGFARHVAPHCEAHLVLAGPSVEGVSDDPEGAEELERVQEAWRALPDDVRARVHVASLPMDDQVENAWMVNALQRRATVVVQKSLAEGFGLTVSEAMWKARPVVASAVGGIEDQIVAGETGELVAPHDLEAFGAAVTALLNDLERADRMGQAARRRVLEHFTGVRHLRDWIDLLEPLVGDPPPPRP